jgi:hypothetical protein
MAKLSRADSAATRNESADLELLPENCAKTVPFLCQNIFFWRWFPAQAPDQKEPTWSTCNTCARIHHFIHLTHKSFPVSHLHDESSRLSPHGIPAAKGLCRSSVRVHEVLRPEAQLTTQREMKKVEAAI